LLYLFKQNMTILSIHHIPPTRQRPTSHVSGNKNCSERITIREHRGCHCKSDESTDGGIDKWVSGMLANAIWTLAKVYHCPMEMLWRKRFVNRYKVTYFCVINQFRELFEANNCFTFPQILCNKWCATVSIDPHE
jgi:hypothetical protein